MPVKGDFAKLNKIVAKLNSVDRTKKAALKSAMEESLNLVAEGFKSGTDPYGRPWNAPNNLQITGRLRSFARKRLDSTGFTIGATDQKAAWHHSPGPNSHLPTRRLVPVGGALPAKWKSRLKGALIDALRKFLRV